MTIEILLTLLVLSVIIILFVFELFRVDVIAIIAMLSLAWLRITTPAEAFSGLSSNAVVSVIAIMILGYGIDQSGAMNRLIQPVLKIAGSSEKKLLSLVCLCAGAISAFIQNIGAAALFLPAMMRISKKRQIPNSRLMMPLGFSVILGGTLSMLGSGSLIVLNDLLKQKSLPGFSLFSVTPIGLLLLFSGILMFLLLGRWILPVRQECFKTHQEKLLETWNLPTHHFLCSIPEKSPLAGKSREESGLWTKYGLNLLALIMKDQKIVFAPWRHTRFLPHQSLVLLGEPDNFERFVQDFQLSKVSHHHRFENMQLAGEIGFADLIIPPNSPVVGKTIREISLRKTWEVEPVMLLSNSNQIRSDFSDQTLNIGDTIIVHGPWDNINALGDMTRFVSLQHFEASPNKKKKPWLALACFLGSILLASLGFPLSVSLFTGAAVMVLLQVISINEAYKAVDWKTVFLIAGLIPMGIAMDKTGAAAYVAGQMLGFLKTAHPILILCATALLTTFFSLFMSNVAATVLLVPLVIILGKETGIDPRVLSLLVAISASNSFILPTHQVNALLMTPGGYSNKDYLKAGGIMSVLFLVIAVGMTYILFL